MTDQEKEAVKYVLTIPHQDNSGGRMGTLTANMMNENFPNGVNSYLVFIAERITERIEFDIKKTSMLKNEFTEQGGLYFDGNLTPLSEEEINKITAMVECFISYAENDEIIDTESLNDDEKKEGLYSSYKLINRLYPRASNAIKPIKITDINTFEMIDYLNEKIKQDGEIFLPYFNSFKKNIETGKIYNVELFLFYSFITSIGYGYTLLSKQYGTRWETVRKQVKTKRASIIAWGDKPPQNMENLYDFAITYQPNKLNQYIVKFLIDVGMSFKAISERLSIKMDKSKKSHHYKSIVLPKPPIKIGK